MKKRKIVSLMLVAVLTLSMALSGCSKKDDEKGNTSTNTTPTAGAATTPGATTAPAAPAAVDHTDTLQLEVYDVAANYQGVQSGWFDKELHHHRMPEER
jgi:multiple sugar transport system substrate-binding protein/putative aldouronate transport system substrate-binding protein